MAMNFLLRRARCLPNKPRVHRSMTIDAPSCKRLFRSMMACNRAINDWPPAHFMNLVTTLAAWSCNAAKRSRLSLNLITSCRACNALRMDWIIAAATRSSLSFLSLI